MPTPADFELPVINPRPKRRPPKRFGRADGFGRQRGSVNKVTKDIKAGVLTAAENLGRDGNGAGGFIGYCEFLGFYHPKAFAHLLGKMLPLQVTGDRPITPGIVLNVMSVESGSYLSAEDIERLRAPGQTIEQAPPLEHHDEPAPAENPDEEFKPRNEKERQLLAELEALNPEELQERARLAGYFDVAGN